MKIITSDLLVQVITIASLIVGAWMADRRRVDRREDRAALTLYRINGGRRTGAEEDPR